MQQYSHLSDISLPVINGISATILIGNDYVTAHRSLESRFSPDPEESPYAILTLLGWVLRGPHFRDHYDSLDEISSNFLLRCFDLPQNVQGLEDMLITDEGEFFPTNPYHRSGRYIENSKKSQGVTGVWT